MTDPSTTPGTDPVRSWRVSVRSNWLLRRYLASPPGPEMTLNSRFVGVTRGLGTCSTDSCTGRRKTAPETPTGVVTAASTKPASAPSRSRCQSNATSTWAEVASCQHAAPLRRPETAGLRQPGVSVTARSVVPCRERPK
jgi:hypothetical protein